MAEYIEVTVLSDQIARIKRSVELNTEFMNSENSTYYLSALQNIEKAIATIPKADVVEVRHGKWKKIQNYALCSNCKHEVNWGSKDFLSLYCPNCGAKMDKESK